MKEWFWNFLFGRDFWNSQVTFFYIAWKKEDDPNDFFEISFSAVIPYWMKCSVGEPLLQYAFRDGNADGSKDINIKITLKEGLQKQLGAG